MYGEEELSPLHNLPKFSSLHASGQRKSGLVFVWSRRVLTPG